MSQYHTVGIWTWIKSNRLKSTSGNPPLLRDKPLGAPAYYETCLLVIQALSSVEMRRKSVDKS